MLKWIHISDLHFINSSDFKMDKLRTELLKEIQKEKEKNGAYNALFLTGDFRFAKNEDGDPKAIAEYIKGIADVGGIPTGNIFCVPGNHDLKRSPIRKALIESPEKYNEENGQFERSIRNILQDDFSFFIEIEKALGHSENESCSFPRMTFLNDCNIVMLNTAITAGKDNERGTLIIGKNDVSETLKKTNKNYPTIVLGHHGMSFWDREEVKEISQMFYDEKVGLYLCGHEHSLWKETVGQGTMQITTGCLYDSSDKAEIGFCTGELTRNKATIKSFYWNVNQKIWLVANDEGVCVVDMPTLKKTNKSSSNSSSFVKEIIIPNDYDSVPKKKYNFQLDGHSLIGPRGSEGIKYYWKKGEETVESLAFNRRATEQSGVDSKTLENDRNTSSYTISVSFGCMLSIMQKQCRFCATGSRVFKGFLTPEEIALQSIFMMYYDMYCESYPEVRTHKREISFMGQGEPGFSYPAIREAIKMIDCAAEVMGQNIYRYVISTCGISDFIPLLIDDINNKVFKNPVTIHFSLHSINEQRNRIMPINIDYNYKEFAGWCKKLYEVTHEKIGVGILMFKNFLPSKRVGEEDIEPITLTEDSLREILIQLDPEIFRIDLCDLNRTAVITREKNMEVSNEEATRLKSVAEELEFETKTFSSFGADRESGCGMLRSEYIDAVPDGVRTKENLKKSFELLHYVSNKIKQ